MGLTNRIGPPFSGSERALAAFNNASYLSITMGLELDKDTGNITTSAPGSENPEPLVGSPGEVMTDPRFYIPRVINEADRIDLAFTLGYCLAKLESVNQNG
ncbi:MAG TPA: hypothetical protein VLF39_00900 [Candidatus Saccharimonadales bacterium]|nr:hypothetical protein [Candidatus Saccharimonadales bacterium]